MAKFDTDQIRRDHLLSAYVESQGIQLKRDGREWKCLCPFHKETTPSFTIYPGAQHPERFQCFGCDAKGDVIEFVQKLHGVLFNEACEILDGKRVPSGERPAPQTIEHAPDVYAAWKPQFPPAGAEAFEPGKRTGPLINPKRDKPARYTPELVHPYHDENGQLVAVVLRVVIDGRKLTPCLMWCENSETGECGWTHHALPDPRPLYRLDQLVARPDDSVMLVEGEKCADAAALAIPRMVAVSWQGGGKATAKTDWSPLAGRRVVVWPDADGPGRETGERLCRHAIEAGAASVRLIHPPEDLPDGWDIADAAADGMTTKEIVAFAKLYAKTWGAPEAPPPEPPPAKGRPSAPPVEALKPTAQEQPSNVVEFPPKKAEKKAKPSSVKPIDGPTMAKLRAACMHEQGSYTPLPKLFKNFTAYLELHPDIAGTFRRNAFTGQITVTRRPPWDHRTGTWHQRPVKDADFSEAAIWLETAGLKPSLSQTADACRTAAERQSFDPVRDYLNGLKWDGLRRLQGGDGVKPWLVELLGAQETESGIERAFGMRWMIAAVARNLSENPHSGEKVDNMLVLEGPQDLGKSKMLRELATLDGVPYFQDGLGKLDAKDTFMQLEGKLIVEVAEMNAIKTASPDQAKEFLSRTEDSYRKPYERTNGWHPRRCVLAGTINPQGKGYLKDPTGARRYWPVFIPGKIDVDLVASQKDQLWAEAVHLYRQGVQWWLTDDEIGPAAEEQAKRYAADIWGDRIDDYMRGRKSVTVDQILEVALFIEVSRRTAKEEERVLSHLQQAGYKRRRSTKDGRSVWVWDPKGATK